MIKVIVAGTRTFNDYELLKAKLDFYFKNRKNEEIEIVSGMAKGADTLGEKYAREKGIKIKQFPAQWATLGKRAGYERNKEMASYATHCICFYDGKSKGTGHMINLAKSFNLHIRIVKY
jgi:predicted Rossmann fold nucleotide-binding protein DprA/Smf involved in DNA uptake